MISRRLQDMILQWHGQGFEIDEIMKCLGPRGVSSEEVEYLLSHATDRQTKAAQSSPECLEPLF